MRDNGSSTPPMRAGHVVQLRPAAGAAGAAGAEDLSDAALAAACATGDRAAQGLLFETHVDAVHRFIARMQTSDPEAVDDLVQATFIAAFQSSATYRGPRLQSWLFGIAVNVARNHVRGAIARRRLALTLSDQPATEAQAPRDADVAKLRAAIGALRPKLRAALVLVDLEGAPGSDAAQTLRIPEGTLWRRLSEARARLRDALGASA
jgi:RNA polymerase sigma-70 factor, ECF subfamily